MGYASFPQSLEDGQCCPPERCQRPCYFTDQNSPFVLVEGRIQYTARQILDGPVHPLQLERLCRCRFFGSRPEPPGAAWVAAATTTETQENRSEQNREWVTTALRATTVRDCCQKAIERRGPYVSPSSAVGLKKGGFEPEFAGFCPLCLHYISVIGILSGSRIRSRCSRMAWCFSGRLTHRSRISGPCCVGRTTSTIWI